MRKHKILKAEDETENIEENIIEVDVLGKMKKKRAIWPINLV